MKENTERIIIIMRRRINYKIGSCIYVPSPLKVHNKFILLCLGYDMLWVFAKEQYTISNGCEQILFENAEI